MNTRYTIQSFSKDIDEATGFIKESIAEPKDEELLIKNTYVGINALYDRELYRGAVPYINVEFPFTIGVEAVGKVIKKGNGVKGFTIGDSVSTVKVGTAYQEYQIVNEEDAVLIPEDSPEYLALNPTGVSAQLAIEKLAEIKAGDIVVISAAAGGLGHILVQLCKMKGAHVCAICGTDEKVKLLESLNSCDRIINYRSEDLNQVIRSEYKGAINVAFDSVGRHVFDILLENLTTLGRLVVVGLASELSAESFERKEMYRVYESMYWKGASVRCFMNHLYKEDHPKSRQFLFDLYQSGELKVKIDERKFEGIESIKEASKYLLAGQSCGKVVVKL